MNKNLSPIITVDGPGGSGKGTLSQMLAREMGWHFLDSGAIYRILAYAVMQNHTSIDDEAAITLLAMTLPIEFKSTATGLKVFLGALEITQQIRSEECGEVASKISVFANVRAALIDVQRAFRQPPGLIADGRDMGTVIFPDATLKFYLTASAEERAKRRYNQLQQAGIHVSLQTILQDILQRDLRDQKRLVAPLKPAEDAILIDTTQLDISQVYALLKEHIKQKINLDD